MEFYDLQESMACFFKKCVMIIFQLKNKYQTHVLVALVIVVDRGTASGILYTGL